MRRYVLFVAGLLGCAGCAGTQAPPSLPTFENPHSIPIVYRHSYCSGDAATYFTDDRGTYLGAVAPGQLTVLEIPPQAKTIHAFSSIDVNAALGSWSAMTSIALAPFPEGLVLDAYRVTARRCGSGQYADIRIAPRSAVATIEAEPRFTPAADKTLLDAHRSRVAELIARSEPNPTGVVSQIYIP